MTRKADRLRRAELRLLRNLIDWEAGIAAVLSRWARSRQLSLDEEALLAAFSQHEATGEAGHPQDLYPAILARSMRGLGSELGAEVSEQDALAAEASGLGIPAERLLHVAQSLFHDHVPAKKADLPTAWINRRQDRPGWGATPAPPADVVPDWEFPSMAAFADAVTAESDRPA
jgi:hypothetical protein